MNRAVALLLISLGLESCTAGLDILIKPIVSPKTIAFNAPSYDLIKGFSMSMFPGFTPKNAINNKITLQSSNPAVAGVTGRRVTSLATGSAVITASSAAGTATMTVNVVNWSPLSISGNVSHVAGSNDSVGSADGNAAGARFFHPYGVCVVGTNLFVTDSNNATIREIDLNTSTVTTLAGTAGVFGAADGTGAAASFNGPGGICSDGANLYITDQNNNSIRKVVIATKTVSLFAGGTSGSNDGAGASAQFQGPVGICIDSTHTNLYVTDSGNSTIRKIIIATAQVSTLAGSANVVGYQEGVGSAAQFNGVDGIATDGPNLYVAEGGNNRIRKIVIASKAVSTLIASSSDGQAKNGSGANASVSYPKSLFCDGSNLLFSDQNGSEIRKMVLATGTVSTLAGGGADGSGAIGWADGKGTAAAFQNGWGAGAHGVCSDGTNVYVADTGNNTIREITSDGQVTTLSGRTPYGNVDGTGTAARFNQPQGICTDQTSLFVTDYGNSFIRKINLATGEVTRFAGNGTTQGDVVEGASGLKAFIPYPGAICTDGQSLFFLDGGSLRRAIISSGVVTTISQTLSSPNQICTDGTYLYITENPGSILKISIDSGSSTTLTTAVNNPGSICTDGSTLYVCENNSQIIKVDSVSGVSSPVATGISGLNSLCTDGTSLYIATGGVVQKIPIISGIDTTIAGGGPTSGDTDGSGTAASFMELVDICATNGHLFVLDSQNNNIREVQ